jgi:cytochrome P450
MKGVMLTGPAAIREYLHFFRDPVGCIRDMSRRHGRLVALALQPFGQPHRVQLLAVGPEFNRQVLGDPAAFRTTGQFIWGPRNSSQQRLRYGLTRMNGLKHKQQRSLVMPPFQKKAVASYHNLIVDLAREIIDSWRPGQVYDVLREMRTLTLRISSSVLFGHEFEDALRISHLLETWTERNFSSPVWLFPMNFPGTAYHRLLQHAEKAEAAILSLISKRRHDPRERTDVLSLLIAARDDANRGMTDAELVGQATILFGASFETTASTLTWTLLLLAQHPGIMTNLMEELDQVLDGEIPTREQLTQLPYLDCIIKESMRILPPVPFTIRAADRDNEMDGLRVPKNSRVICSHYLTHHLPELYPEPERFLPERWRTIDPTQYEYFPFSAGPRACIGVMFALQVLKISLAMMLQRFRFTIVPGTRVDRVVRITMTPRYGLPMLIEKNDRRFIASKLHGQIHEMVALTES